MIGAWKGLTISKVAAETGFSPSALRFSECHGLISPARTPAGYRSYDAASVETLRSIARAKRLGLSLRLHPCRSAPLLWSGPASIR